MRRSLITVLVALLIAIFAIGAPIPAKASCQGGSECTMLQAGMANGSCEHKGEPCKVAPNCASPLQKMPAYYSVRIGAGVSQTRYSPLTDSLIASAFILPETAPPRA